MTDGGARVVEDIQESEERTVKRRGRPKAIDQLMSYKPAKVFTSRITVGDPLAVSDGFETRS